MSEIKDKAVKVSALKFLYDYNKDTYGTKEEVNRLSNEKADKAEVLALEEAIAERPVLVCVCVLTYDDTDYHCLAISYDGGVCWNKLPGTENFAADHAALHSEGYICKHDDTYIITFTDSNSNTLQYDLACVYTKDFKTFEWERISLGIGAHLNETLGISATNCHRWTPQLFHDKSGDLYLLITCSFAEPEENDRWGITSWRQVKLYYAKVTLVDGKVRTTTGTFADFTVLNVPHDTYMDGCIQYDAEQDIYRLVYKDRYNEWINYATASNLTDEFEDQIENIFFMAYTEAPIIYKTGSIWNICCQKYTITGGYEADLVAITSDFLEFEYKIMNFYDTHVEILENENNRVRNPAPFFLTDPQIIKYFNSLNPSTYIGESRKKQLVKNITTSSAEYITKMFVPLPGVSYNLKTNFECVYKDLFNVGLVPLHTDLVNCQLKLQKNNNTNPVNTLNIQKPLITLLQTQENSACVSQSSILVFAKSLSNGLNVRLYYDRHLFYGAYIFGTLTEDLESKVYTCSGMSNLDVQINGIISEHINNLDSAGSYAIISMPNNTVQFRMTNPLPSGTTVTFGSMHVY